MDDHAPLKQTPLHALHLSLGARMVPFAGYDMPGQYPSGILKEHLHTRDAAGLFDVSHMGQIELRPRTGTLDEAALALEALVPVDVVGIAEGRQRYALFTDETGGILDDLMIARLPGRFLIVVNAACKQADFAHLTAHLGDRFDLTLLEDRALLALQGPRAEGVLAELWGDVAAMRFMDVAEAPIHDVPCTISRSGYTGEDGFEISVPADRAQDVARRLLDHPDVLPIGLGARDSLRLEAGLCLYGSDIDTNTCPIEAALEWAIQKTRRAGGVRSGGFPGARAILDAQTKGASMRRVGLKPVGKAPVRGGAKLYADATGTTEVGIVTSGSFGPSVGHPVAMGYVQTGLATPGATVFAELRGKYIPMTVAALPFITPTYKR